MDKASTNGHSYLTKEKFLQLSTFEIDLLDLGIVKFRKIGRAEYEAFWPLLPEAADDWPQILPVLRDETREQTDARDESRVARRQAEAAWLRAQPDAEQVRWRTRANDVGFRTIAACCKQPTFTVDDARALGDAAEVLFAAILTKSGLITEPIPAPAPASEAVEPAPVTP
jgi:hypothetical protein